MAKLTAEQIAEMAAGFGMTVEVEDIKTLEENIPTRDEVSEAKGDRLREADGVLRSLHYPHQLKVKMCDWCGEPFQTNYCSVGMCSANCRKRYLEERFGLKWSPVGKATWGEYEPPLIISAEATSQLERWAREFLSNLDDVRARNPETLQNPTQEQMRNREGPQNPTGSSTPGLDDLFRKWGEAPISGPEDSQSSPQPLGPLSEPDDLAPASPPGEPALPDFDTEDFGSFEL